MLLVTYMYHRNNLLTEEPDITSAEGTQQKWPLYTGWI